MTNRRYQKVAKIHPGITAVDEETLRLCALGYSNKEIGEMILRQEETVKHRVARLLARLGAKNRTHAVALGYEKGLLMVDTDAENKQLRATIAGIRAKNSELEKKLADTEHQLRLAKGELAAADAAEKLDREVRLHRQQVAPRTSWLDSSQGKL